ncbi:Repeat domain-containing protein [Tenacibaculum sp. MAR_2009_124]|uniref:VCBS repeat-containing protein n=1 Tax=Tenacibaculum sp. MAR_2009_124 TaxID=1250059 RepID=UPI0008959125|nr:VCBS repeat-containing protein [Tenacibaculum sp. MAR_2009_124]SEB72785.1 Repeat domain-containing protein [Tenacibaculum sp. MAR_2009_124]
MKKIILLFALNLIISCSNEIQKKDYLLTKLPPKQTNINFVNKISDEVNHNIINYIYYYNGGGVAVGDINNDELPDLFFVSNKGQNKLYLNKGNLQFEDISKTAGIEGMADWQTGVTMVDINNDGYLDVYICAVSELIGFKGHNELYINNGDNTFTEKSKEYNLDYVGYSTQSYFFDYDKDNDLDVYIVNHAVHTKTSNGPALLREKRTSLTGDVLLKNTNQKFEDASKDAKIYGGVNGYGLSASVADFNNDGWDDIYVCNDFHEDDYYYLNNQDGTFTESLTKSFSTISRFSMGSDAADINGDGLQDLITLDMLPKDERVVKESEGDDAMLNIQYILKKLGYQDQYARNMLQINNQGNYFHEEALYNDIADTDWSWSPLLADFNNDGHQDLFIANGILRRPNDLDFRMYISSKIKDRALQKKNKNWLLESLKEMPNGAYPDQIFEGNSVQFKNRNGNWLENNPTLSNGAIYSDLDNDGDLDLITNNINQPAQVFENQTNSTRNFIKFKFEYQKGNENGIGTKVIVHNDNKKQTKQLFNSRGFISSVSNSLHFGINHQNKIDSVKIIWPDNTYRIITNPEINKLNVVSYNKEIDKQYAYRKNKNEVKFNRTDYVNYIHKEDFYNDFYNEKLIPYKISNNGPGFAKGDINNDGFEDFFIGNASEKQSHIYINNGKTIKEVNFPEIAKDSIFEDTCATFIDVDNDNDLDLYIGSGLHSIRMNSFEQDRLYINEKGAFKKAKNVFKNTNNTSCIKPYDYDNDGDMDVFIGNRSNPNDFGSKVSSYLLKNDGKGNFTPDENFTLESKVTDAVWSDINNDNIKDLIVTTEWDTPKIYLNNKGKLEQQETPLSNGLWQTVTTFDIDNDGDLDIVFGNWGLNTRFRTSKENPILMYHGDFDNNNKNETVLAYKIEGKYYPIHSKDELASQMNIIKKRFINYSDYALKPIEDVLTQEALNKATKYEITELASGYLENNNGNFDKFNTLPKTFQLAPISSFKEIVFKDEQPQLLVFGNLKSVNTYHGGYEGNKGLLIKDINNYQNLTSLGVSPINSQVKLSEVIKMKDKQLLLIIQNNDSIKQYTTQK